MTREALRTPAALPAPGAIVEVLKPITWFPPMWAFACGVVSAGHPVDGRWLTIVAGLALAGPLVCAASQAANDWYDRDVDAINEPQRPIPSGRLPGRWGLAVAVVWSLLGLAVGAALGAWMLVATAVGVAFAWAYSAPPLRLKRNGWWGNAACGLCYEGVAWIAGAVALAAFAAPDPRIVAIALLYSAGAHGIMTLNDFKSVEGDRRMGIGSLPVRLGPRRAGLVACAFMALPQAVVVALLLAWGAGVHAAAVAGVLAAQLLLMRRLLRDPRALAPWYNATGVSLYVAGMMASALALRGLAGAS